jgi:hypothetical protein
MSVLVLMPFSREFDRVYTAIATGCEPVGENPLRVDRKLLTTDILPGVFRNLFERDFVVADLSGARANVTYELAIAHMMNKPVLYLIRQGERPPFYLSQLQLHPYRPPSPRQPVRMKDGGEMSAFVTQALTELRGKDFEHSRTTRSNPLLRALGTTELLKTQLPWLSGYRQSYRREAQAKAVWVFEKSFYWEQSLGAYQTMIRAGIAQGTRRYWYLLPDSPEVLDKARRVREWLLDGSTGAFATPHLEMRMDDSALFDALPCSIMLYDPYTPAAAGILSEPMKEQVGEDPYDEAIRDMAVEVIPGWMDLQERTYDIRLDPKQVERYSRLFRHVWERARPLD